MADSNAIEVWIAVPDWGGYEVSSQGRFRSVKRDRPALLRIEVNRGGYACVRPQKNGRHTRKNLRLHRLVAAAFLGACPAGFEVNHKNGLKLDNRVENLEYVTPQQNSIHRVKSGLTDQIGETHYKAKVTPDDVIAIRSSKESSTVLARRYHINESQVRRIRRRVDWAHVN